MKHVLVLCSPPTRPFNLCFLVEATPLYHLISPPIVDVVLSLQYIASQNEAAPSAQYLVMRGPQHYGRAEAEAVYNPPPRSLFFSDPPSWSQLSDQRSQQNRCFCSWLPGAGAMPLQINYLQINVQSTSTGRVAVVLGGGRSLGSPRIYVALNV